jgi:hypothetical protein
MSTKITRALAEVIRPQFIVILGHIGGKIRPDPLKPRMAAIMNTEAFPPGKALKRNFWIQFFA